MQRTVPPLVLLVLALSALRPASAQQQKPEIKFIADTLVVEAEGTYETDPDLATLTFNISAQDKDMKKAYDTAAQSTLTLTPSYDKDRKNKAKSYFVQGEIILKVHDFAQIAPILDGAVQDGIVDFRSLVYSLQDEEAAKEKAVANAMKSAVGRATSALAQNNQKPGAIRYASLDVRQLVGVTQIYTNQVASLSESVVVGGNADRVAAPPAAPPPLPTVRPRKITVTATVQCAFQIQ
jgi:uncharacterized protein YggE